VTDDEQLGGRMPRVLKTKQREGRLSGFQAKRKSSNLGLKRTSQKEGDIERRLTVSAGQTQGPGSETGREQKRRVRVNMRILQNWRSGRPLRRGRGGRLGTGNALLCG